MARGWESKGVEEQQAEARASGASSRKSALTPQQIEQQKRQVALRLSRSRILQQMETAQNPVYRQTLEAALEALDRQLAAFNGPEV